MGIFNTLLGMFSSSNKTGEKNDVSNKRFDTEAITIHHYDSNHLDNSGKVSKSINKSNKHSKKLQKRHGKSVHLNKKAGKKKAMKMIIHNLIIIDESGSMSNLVGSTISGVNEVINTIKSAQKEYADSQEHYLTIVTFDSPGYKNQSVRTIVDDLPITEITEFSDYTPRGCTPLYDAMGISLSRIHQTTKGNSYSIGSVTVVTDGLENASRVWNATMLRDLINQQKEEGWTFSYMGSAHDVKDVTELLSIDNFVEFAHTGMAAMHSWERERSAKQAYFRRVSKMNYEEMSDRSFKIRKQEMASRYYECRITPDYINELKDYEIFVFGSNPEGVHNGGASSVALQKFGAKMGVGEGIQGQSYAIPSTEGKKLLSEAIHRFCIYAKEHPGNRFLVIRIGCGIDGYSSREVAPLFKEAIELENVSLPDDFWKYLGLRM